MHEVRGAPPGQGEKFGAAIAALLFDEPACADRYVRGDKQWTRWSGVHAGQALDVSTSWPLVERDLDPETLARGVAEGWAEAETDPTQIDWPARQADA